MEARPYSNRAFRAMAFWFKIRDFFSRPMSVLNEVGVRPGSQALDFGCGPGSYIPPLAKLVGVSGKVYALDFHPLAIKTVRNLAKRKRLANVESIRSDCDTGLPDGSIDVALLYDTLHDLTDPDAVLAELSRALKPGGILSVTDHHMKGNEIVGRVTDGGLFHLSKKGENTYGFVKAE